MSYTSIQFDVFAKQTFRLTAANLKSRYRRTFAGLVWVILNPLIMFGVQSLIFSNILKLGVPNYGMFLLSGLLPWLFMVQTIEMCTPMLQFSGPLLKAFPVNPLVYITAQMIDNFLNFTIAFSIIFIPLSFSDPGPHWRFLLLPLATVTLVIGVLGMAWLLATLQVFMRDTRFITTFILNISFYLTPVFYPTSFIPEGFQWIPEINPFYTLIAPFQACISMFDPAVFWYRLGKAALFAFVLMSAGALLWRKKRNDLYFHV